MISEIEKWLEEGKGGYTEEQLQKAFEMVENPTHWKADINTVVESNMKNILLCAIPWYSGAGRIEFFDMEGGKMLVKATGYWSNGME